MWTAIAVTVAIVAALVFVVKTGTIARGLKREHLAEVLNGIARVKAAGRGMEIAAPEPPRDAAEAASRGIVTTVGVVIAWSARRDGDVYVHRMSISGRGPSWAFRGVMFAFVLDRLGLKADDAVSSRSPAGVDHLQIEVSRADHEAMGGRPLRPVPDQAFRVYLADLCAARDKIRRVAWDASPMAAAA